MPSSGSQSQPSVVTTVAVTLSICALVVGVAVFAAVLSDDDAETGTAVAAAEGPAEPAAPASRIDFAAPWDDAFVARDPALAPADAATVYEIKLSATETELEVAPGVTQVMWTFNDQVPGPTVRGKVGDVFRFTLTNDGELPHSIDFHASKVAWNDEMRSINPGETAPHNLTVEAGPHTPDLNGGDAYEMPLAPLTPATYTVFCSIPGHREAGMEAELVLE